MIYDDLVRQGKLRYVALSSHPAWQVTQALWIAKPASEGRIGIDPAARIAMR
jgi:aryl-alcohol dehydrogenase-like predicted oxidoreductase